MYGNAFWKPVKFPSLRIEKWNEGVTVFQPDSGKTHFLNEMSFQIILNLNKFSVTDEELCRTLADQFQLTNDENFFQQIIKTLHHFDELGLIEKVRLEYSP